MKVINISEVSIHDANFYLIMKVINISEVSIHDANFYPDRDDAQTEDSW